MPHDATVAFKDSIVSQLSSVGPQSCPEWHRKGPPQCRPICVWSQGWCHDVQNKRSLQVPKTGSKNRFQKQVPKTGSTHRSVRSKSLQCFFLSCRQLAGCPDVVETSVFQGAILFGDGAICAGPDLPFSIGNAALGTCHHTSSMSMTPGSLGSCYMGWPLCSCCWASRSAAEGFISCRLREWKHATWTKGIDCADVQIFFLPPKLIEFIYPHLVFLKFSFLKSSLKLHF
jgi:hypothetical protein